MIQNKDSGIRHRTELLIKWIVVAIAVLGISSLVGWVFGIEPLLRWSGAIHMRFNTALCLVIASAGLWIASSVASSSRIEVLTRLCGISVGVVALLTIAEHAFRIDLHIDQLLWRDRFSVTNPGRIALLTALVLACAGVFLVGIRSRRPAVVGAAQVIAIIATLGAQGSVIDVLLRKGAGTGVAPNTACALLLLCIGMIMMPSGHGFLQPIARETVGGRFLRRLLPTVIISPIALAWLRWRLDEWGALGADSGMVLLVSACTAALMVMTVWTAATSDAVDRERTRLQQELTGFFNLPLHSMLTIIGFDGRFRRLSSSWTHILGYGEEELLQTPYLDLIHPDDREHTQRCAEEIAAGTSVSGFENRYRTSDGAYRWLMWNAIPAGGEVMYAVAEDITDRKRIETELRENAERSRLLIEGLEGIALYMLDEQARIITWNSGAHQLTGFSEQEVLGKPVSMLYSPEEAPNITGEYLHAMASRPDRKELQTWRMRKDGSRYLAEAYISALHDPQGRFIGFAKVVRDVTQRVAVEDKIRQLNEELEERVKQRTCELMASNRELEAFAYSVSHDLRAPLRHLDGFLSLLRRRCYAQLDTSARHYVDATTEASRRMGVLIDDLLQFSRLGRTSIHPSEIDLEEVIRDVRRELQIEATKRDVHWEVGALPRVFADRTLLHQVVQNLLANALKFTRTREQARIRISAETGEDGEVTITVADNGVGFDMQYYNKLFGVFQRLHTEDEFEGTGIGLANVRRIVERHNGRVWAEGQIDKGASFHFTLPACEIETEDKNHNELIESYSAG